ncbi:hypothetical protein KBI52_01105, partial [Microvirga sp. HBU67558]|nr:hypothetical protein [Microvirga sp. HBU67558]
MVAEPTLANRRYKPPDADALPPALQVVAHAKEVSHPDNLGRESFKTHANCAAPSLEVISPSWS